MGIETKTIRIITCDICGSACGEDDGKIKIQVNSGDGRDVGPATIEGRVSFFQPYGAQNGIVCVPCKKKWLSNYISNL